MNIPGLLPSFTSVRSSGLVIALMVALLPAQASGQTSGKNQTIDATLALFAAATKNDIEAARRAVAAGADILAFNNLGQRAHDVAADLGNMDMAHYLLSVRPKAGKKYRAAVQRQSGTTPKVATIAAPARQQNIQPPVRPLSASLKKPSRTAKAIPKTPQDESPVVIALSKSRALELSKQARQKDAPTTKAPFVKAALSQKPAVKSPAPRKTSAADVFNLFGNRIPIEIGSLPDGTGLKCIEKPDNIRICLWPMSWPASLEKHFSISTVYYKGTSSLVMYRDDQLQQIHVLFLRSGFDDVLEFVSTALYGAGQLKVLKRSAETRMYLGRKNRIVSWRGLKGSRPDSLEIRELDSLRWSAMPDENHGVLRVIRKGDDPVFKHISSADFLLGFLSTPQRRKK